MLKITNSLIALSVVGALSSSVSSPTLAKTKAKANSYRAASPSYQYVRRPVVVAPVVHHCRHGVWDPYGVRCDDPVGSR
jgi:hypothetical protein